jgi:hypothetical protein
MIEGMDHLRILVLVFELPWNVASVALLPEVFFSLVVP